MQDLLVSALMMRKSFMFNAEKIQEWSVFSQFTVLLMHIDFYKN